MSWRASAYIKQLVVCPNGERISRTEKLVALVLADSHQDKAGSRTYPAVKTIAEDSLMDPRVCRRILSSLERKGLIERQRAMNQGRGQLTFYRFPALDGKEDNMSPFFLAKRGTEGGRKEDKTRTASMEEQEQEQKHLPPLPPAPRGERALSVPKLSLVSEPGSRGREIDRAMKACNFTARRIRRTLEAVFSQREGPDEDSEQTADKVIDAWQRYGKQGKRLFRRRSPGEFFEGGLWLNSNLWDWDTQQLRDEQRTVDASIGSMR